MEVSKDLLDRAQVSMQVAQSSIVHATRGVELADEDLVRARNALVYAQEGLDSARRNTQLQFDEMVELLTGAPISNYVISQAEEDIRRVRVTVDPQNHRHKAIIDSLQKIAVEAEEAIKKGRLQDVYKVYGSSIFLNYDKATPQRAVNALQDMSISLYSGLFTIKWSPLTPDRFDVELNPKIGGYDFTYTPERSRMHKRDMLAVLGRFIKNNDDFIVMGNKVEQLRNAILNYQGAVSWVEFSKKVLNDSVENKLRAEANLRKAKDFLETQQFELERAKQNLKRKEGDFQGAQLGLKEAERDAEDVITQEEAQGVFATQLPPNVEPQSDKDVDKTNILPSDDGVRSQKNRIFSLVVTRLVYFIVGYILVLFNIDTFEKMKNKRAIAEAKQKAKIEANPAAQKGLLGRLVQYFSFDNITVSEIVAFSGRRVLNLAKNKKQFARISRLMKKWGIDTFAVVSDEMKTDAKFVDIEELNYKSIFSDERIKNLPMLDRLVYRTRLFSRLFRSSYDDVITSGKFKLRWFIGSSVVGILISPFAAFPTLPLKIIGMLPVIWGGSPVFSPLIYLTPFISLPWFVWIPVLYFAPRVLYNSVVMIPVILSVLKLGVFLGFGIFKYFYTKALFVALIPVLPAWALIKKVFKIKKFDLKDIQNAPDFLVNKTVSLLRNVINRARKTTPAGKDYSVEFSKTVIEKARLWALENGLGELEEMSKDQAQMLINSFIIEDTIKNTKHIVFQDVGNSLRVNVGAEVDDLALFPGMFASMPAIYVPFFLPTKAHFNKWFWGIMIQNITQSLQYSASMGARAIRGAERGATSRHKIFAHIVSKSELDIHSFLFMVQPRWLVGHLHVIREELVGGRIVLDLDFVDSRELKTKEAPEGIEQWDNVEDYVRYLIDRGLDLPELDEETFEQIFSGEFQLDVKLPDSMPADEQAAFRKSVQAQFKFLSQIAAGYYRAYPDEFNPFYGPGENITFSGYFPDVNQLGKDDKFGIGTYEPTEGVFYARGNNYGGLNYAAGGVNISGEDGHLSFEPTGEIARVDYQQKVGGSKATNLNAILLVIQGQTYLSREIETNPDGSKKLKIAFKDAHEEFLPEVSKAKQEFKKKAEQKDRAFRKGWKKTAKKVYARIFDNNSKTFVSADLGSNLGFAVFPGIRGLLAKWKTLTIGAIIGILPVSLYGLLQDPLNAAMQSYYNPALVKKEANFEIFTNKTTFDSLSSIYQQTPDLLENKTVLLDKDTFRFPTKEDLQIRSNRIGFAKALYELSRNVGIHIPQQMFIDNSDLLQNSYGSLREFFIAVEKQRIEQRRNQIGGKITTLDKGLTEYGTIFLNSQDYLKRLSMVFPDESQEQEGLEYLASTIGNSKDIITIDVVDFDGSVTNYEFEANTGYQYGVYNRTSQRYIAAYNYISGKTYHGSHEDDSHRSGAVEKQLGDRDREPVVRLGQERNELQGTRSWTMVSPKGPLSIFQMKTMAKKIRNGSLNPQAAAFITELVDVANRNGTPIAQVIIHDGKGNAPSSNPADWNIIIVSDSKKFLMSAGQAMSLVKKVLAQDNFKSLNLKDSKIDVIHWDGFSTLEQLKILTSEGKELENYDEKVKEINSSATEKLIDTTVKSGLLAPELTKVRFESLLSIVNEKYKDRLAAQIDNINQLYEKQGKITNFIRSIFTINKNNLFDKIITIPITFLFKHSLLATGISLLTFGVIPSYTFILGLITSAIVTPSLLSVFIGAIAVNAVILLPIALFFSILNYRNIILIAKELRSLREILNDNTVASIPLHKKLFILTTEHPDRQAQFGYGWNWKAEHTRMQENLKVADLDANASSPVRSLYEGFRADTSLLHEKYKDMLRESDIVRSALINGVVIEPSTVDEEYLASSVVADDGTEQSFQDFNYDQTYIEPAIEELSDEFARRGKLLLDNLRRAATENPDELLRSVNDYIRQRKEAEAPLGYEDRFEYATPEDIKALADLSRDLKNDGFIDVGTRSHRQDVKILGKLFGLSFQDSMDMLGSYWSEAEWPVAIGIPFMPGSSKGRFRMAKRGGHVEDARPIPVLSALITFAEPPWLAGLSAFNILDTEADDPAFALAEDTKFGIMGVFNPPLYPNTPAISIHLKNYIEEQYERRLFGENSLKTAAQVGKGFSVLNGMTNLFTHPVFIFGGDEAVRGDWQEVLDNIFNSNAMKRDEIAYEGAGRGSGWLNYIIFGYSLYGHLAKRVGPFAPGVGQAVRQIQYLNELDAKMNGRLLKMVRFLQIIADKPIFNGLYGVDFRLALSIVKGLEQLEVTGKSTDDVINELIDVALRDALSNLSPEDRRRAYESFEAGNDLLGQDLLFPVDLLENLLVEDTLAVQTPLDLTGDEQAIVDELLLEGYTQTDINEIIVNVRDLPLEARLAALQNVKQVTMTPAHELEGAKDTLWQFRFSKAIPRAITRIPILKKLLKTALNVTVIVGSVMLWGYWAMAIPLMFMIFEAMGMFKGTPVKNFLRLFFGGISVLIMIGLSGGLAALSLPQLGLLYIYFTGGEKGANYLLYMIDRIPISIMTWRTNKYNILALEDKLNFLEQNDRFDPEEKRAIVKEVIDSIGKGPQTSEEYDRKFRQQFILASLEKAYIAKLRQYYQDIYGEQANKIESDINSSLSKFAVDQRLRIVKKIYERLTGSFSKFDSLFYLLTKVKPGEEMPYKSKLGFFRKFFTNREKEKVLRAVALTFISASAIFLLGMPQTLIGLFAFALINSIVLFIGTKSFEQTLGAVTGLMWPVLHAAISPYSASNMPLVIIIAEILGGYMVGSTFGLLLKNSIELIYNFVINPFAVKPYKASERLEKISAKSDRIKQRILLSSVVPLINEVDSDLEFKSKFDLLYFDTIESVIDYEEGAGGIDIDTQTPPDDGSAPSDDGTAPSDDGTAPSDDGEGPVIGSDQSPDLTGPDSGPQTPETTHRSRIQSLSDYMASALKLDDSEMHNISNAVIALTDSEGDSLEKAEILLTSIDRQGTQLPLSSILNVNRNRKQLNLKQAKINVISDERRIALDQAVDNFENELMYFAEQIAEQSGVSYLEFTNKTMYSRDQLRDAVIEFKQSQTERLLGLKLSEQVREQKLAELESRFEDILSGIDQLFDFYNQSTNRLINEILFVASTIESISFIAKTDFNLMALLQKALVEGKISREVYDMVARWIFDDENMDFISLVASSLGKNMDLPDSEIVTYIIEHEIRPFKEKYTTRPYDYLSKPTDLLTANETLEVEQSVLSTDDIFQQFDVTGNTKNLADYLESYNRNTSTLPAVNAILANPILSRVPRGSFNPSQVLDTVLGILDEAGLDYTHAVQLIKVLEDSGYMLSALGQKDLIMIDIETLGLTNVENRGNQNHKLFIEQYINALRTRYAQANRQVEIMLFSSDKSSYDINQLIGEGLSGKVNMVYGKELFDDIFALDSSEKFIRFFIERISNQNVNRLNMKVFSNRHDIMNAAKDMGAILADRNGNIFDALKVFANIHPSVSATNLYPAVEGTGVADALQSGNIMLLGGQEISASPNKSLLNKKNFVHLIDRAA